ncbi:MAG: hypothetical protein ACI9G1_000144 [Pirellulaceae bacterium]|jgi:hypothetical protein
MENVVQDSSMPLALSLIAATLGGLALNGWLLWRLNGNALPRWHAVLLVVFCGLLVHLFLVVCVSAILIAVLEVSPEQQEAVGYFVGPNVIAFVSVPLVLAMLHFFSRTKTE